MLTRIYAIRWNHIDLEGFVRYNIVPICVYHLTSPFYANILFEQNT
jgi:hypothetical protein